MYEVFDNNFFATDFHLDMFCREFGYEKFDLLNTGKAHIVGWPMEYLQHELKEYDKPAKENIILFPHRIAPEKQVDIFKDLAETMPEYDWIVCQEQTLTKQEYHELLGRAKIVFSANTQETLGISCYEGALVGASPMVPDRLSYSEMALPEFKYPSEWTESWEAYQMNKDKVIEIYDTVAEQVNETFPGFMNEAFNCPQVLGEVIKACLLYTSPSPRDKRQCGMAW